MGDTARWRQYQQDVADLLTELGFETKVEDKIESARGVTHEVDVSARRTVAGVPVLWVVECKLWRSRVGKEKVAALTAICDDLGADRGVLMSETGFQSGALHMAVGRSITLSNLEDVRTNARADLLAARKQEIERRIYRIDSALRFIDPAQEFPPERFLRVLYSASSEEVKERCRAASEAAFFADDAEFSQLADEALGICNPDGNSRFADGLEGFLGPSSQLPDHSDCAHRHVRTKIEEMHLAVSRGSSGYWPIILKDVTATGRVAWSLEQLLDVIEPVLKFFEYSCFLELLVYDTVEEALTTGSSTHPVLRSEDIEAAQQAAWNIYIQACRDAERCLYAGCPARSLAHSYCPAHQPG